MSILTRDDLRSVIRKPRGWCVSVFMSTHRAGREIQQDRIRLKNLLGEAEERLGASGLRVPEAKELLEPAGRLLHDGLFWQHQSDGLAIFLSSEVFRTYCLPFDFEELVVVTDRFHIKPLLPILSGDGRFYVLALSQNQLRLLQGSRYSVSEVNLAEVPASLAEALRYDDPEKRLQWHTQTGTKTDGERAAIFHGHGVASADDPKNYILRYFHRVDEGFRDLVGGEEAPLVLAGVDYLLPIYKEANTYPHLVDEGIEGNPEELSAEELHEQAWAIVHPLFLASQKEAAARYSQLAGASSARTSSDLRKVVTAAYHGRVETLFVAVALQRWGHFEIQKNTVQLHGEAEPGDEDLLDFAAVQTLLNGGTVYAVEPEKVPDEAPLAAVLRY
ncbi:MAG: hypothetical protein SVX38_00800 [Chloroflexota bacterium]|nr:hypothetical protein [Chloroflexota bacterium]